MRNTVPNNISERYEIFFKCIPRKKLKKWKKEGKEKKNKQNKIEKVSA